MTPPAAMPVANPGPRALGRDAKILLALGARIIPIGFDKRPLLKWGKFRTVEPTMDEIREWCLDSRTAGWAVLTGPVSGNGVKGQGWQVIDVEAAGMLYPEILRPLDPLPDTCKRDSQHGGRHAHVMVYGTSDDYDWGGKPIARVKSKSTGMPVLLVEYRGDGQYAVITGPGRPVLPENFEPYEGTGEFFDALIAPGRALNDPSLSRGQSLAAASSAAVTAFAGKRVKGDTGDALRQAVLEQPDIWPLLLDPGWTIVSVQPDCHRADDGTLETRVTMQRPDYGGKAAEGESANTQGAVMVNFSSSVTWWPTDKIGKGLNPIQAMTAAWFDGDYRAAASAAELAAKNFVVDGVLPDPVSAFAQWPEWLLEDVHAARVKHSQEYTTLTATGGMSAEDPPIAEGPLPSEADGPNATVTGITDLTARQEAAKADAEAKKHEDDVAEALRKMRVQEEARERLAEHKAREAETRISEAESRGENPLGWLTFDQNFWDTDPSWVFLLPGIWPVGVSGAVYSGPGAGKSLIGLEWGACLATGQDVIGAPCTRRRVLYLDYENDPQLIRQRLGAMGFGAADDLSWLTYSMLGEWPPLDTAAGGARLLAEASRLDVALVLIDTTARVIEGEENAADTFHALYRHTVLPLKRAGVAVLRFDHIGKEVERGERGSSAKRGDVDLSYELTADPAGRYVTLRRVKNRPHLSTPEALVLERVTSPRLRHLPIAPGTVTVSPASGIAGPNPAVEAVVRYVLDNPGCGAHDIEKGLAAAGVKVGKARIGEARHIAETLGRIKVENGPNKRKLHFPGDPDGDISEFVRGMKP